MNNIKDGKENRKIFVYSTHEYMVLALLQALGIYNGTSASYGEGIVFALFNNNSTDYYLKVLFIQHENDTSELKPIKLPNCSNETCPLSELKISISEFILNNWDVECGNVKPSNMTSSMQMDQV